MDFSYTKIYKIITNHTKFIKEKNDKKINKNPYIIELLHKSKHSQHYLPNVVFKSPFLRSLLNFWVENLVSLSIVALSIAVIILFKSTNSFLNVLDRVYKS